MLRREEIDFPDLVYRRTTILTYKKYMYSCTQLLLEEIGKGKGIIVIFPWISGLCLIVFTWRSGVGGL